MTPKEELEKVTQLCRATGVTESQAKLMAESLIKRSGQLAVERNISRVEAMNHLLGLLLKGLGR